MMDRAAQWQDAELEGATRVETGEVERVMWLIRDRLDEIPHGIPRRHHVHLADALLRVAIERMLAAQPSQAIESRLLDLLASLSVARIDKQERLDRSPPAQHQPCPPNR